MGFDPAPEVPEPAEPVQAAPEENPVGKAQNSIAEAFSPAPALSSGMVRKPALVPPVNGTKTPARRAAPGSKDKAAFTLRLDNQRHLKLRVACAMSHRSAQQRSEEHTSDLQSLMRTSYAVFCLKKKTKTLSNPA